MDKDGGEAAEKDVIHRSRECCMVLQSGEQRLLSLSERHVARSGEATARHALYSCIIAPDNGNRGNVQMRKTTQVVGQAGLRHLLALTLTRPA